MILHNNSDEDITIDNRQIDPGQTFNIEDGVGRELLADIPSLELAEGSSEPDTVEEVKEEVTPEVKEEVKEETA